MGREEACRRICGESETVMGTEQEREHCVPEPEYFPDAAVCCCCCCFCLWGWKWFCSHCWASYWKSITVPCELCWGTSHGVKQPLFPSLHLPWASCSLDDCTAVAAGILLKCCWCKCWQRSSLSLRSPCAHTQWPQRWSRRLQGAGPEMLPLLGPSVHNFYIQKYEANVKVTETIKIYPVFVCGKRGVVCCCFCCDYVKYCWRAWKMLANMILRVHQK